MFDNIQHLREILWYSVDSIPERVSIYFKTSPGDYAEHDRFMGITVPVLRKIAKRFITITPVWSWLGCGKLISASFLRNNFSHRQCKHSQAIK